MVNVRLRRQNNEIDRYLLFVTLALVVIGILSVANASSPQAQAVFSDRLYFAKQQSIWAGIGVVLMLIATKINYLRWQKLAPYIFFTSIILLIAVLVPQVGTSVLGARRWINLGFMSFQPSELMKLSLAIYLARLAVSKKPILSSFIPLAIVIALIMAQPDLGTSIVLGFIAFTQLFASGVSLLLMTGMGTLAVLVSTLLVLSSGYRKQRFLTFTESISDPLGSAYHVKQILLALGSGGLFGVGLGQSRQKFLFLPEAATDSVFAVIAEEVGFVGATIFIALIAFFIIRGLSISANAPEPFGRILGYGIVAWIGGQAVLNIAGMVALLPITGIPLPFVSYGGTALIMVLFAVGVLLNISKHATKTKH